MPVEDFPSNAKSRPAQQPPAEKSVESVVSGKVIKKKTPLHKKFAGTFFGGDARNALDYVVQYVVIPSAQKMFMDVITNGSSRIIYRDPHNAGYPQAQQGSAFTPYGRFSTSGSVQKPAAPIFSPQARATHDFGEIVLEDRVSAERVINGLYDLLNQYESVSVKDLYSLLGVSSDYTDQTWGWTDLRGSDIRVVPQGYLLILPKPKAL